MDRAAPRPGQSGSPSSNRQLSARNTSPNRSCQVERDQVRLDELERPRA